MELHVQELPPIGTNAFLLLEQSLKTAFVIDAPADAFEWASALAAQHDCKIEALILTHGHWDHIIDAHLFAKAGVKIFGHMNDQVLFEEPEKMASYAIPGLKLQPVSINQWVVAGDVLELAGQSFEVRHVPGHCPGNILLYSKELEAAFVGDVIFAGSVGRYDLPGGDFKVLEKSIQTQVFTLPVATTLYSGHGPKTSVQVEIAGNPFVRPL
jgi:glyoxylase-like metal-dependent hydrolase (beta-lactamase superfamily II)